MRWPSYNANSSADSDPQITNGGKDRECESCIETGAVRGRLSGLLIRLTGFDSRRLQALNAIARQ